MGGSRSAADRDAVSSEVPVRHRNKPLDVRFSLGRIQIEGGPTRCSTRVIVMPWRFSNRTTTGLSEQCVAASDAEQCRNRWMGVSPGGKPFAGDGPSCSVRTPRRLSLCLGGETRLPPLIVRSQSANGALRCGPLKVQNTPTGLSSAAGNNAREGSTLQWVSS